MNNKKNDDDKNKRPKWIRMLIAALVAMIALSFLSRSLLAGMTGSLTYSEFLKILETENVKSVTFNEYYNKISATVTDARNKKKVYTTGIVDKEAALEIINKRNIPYSGTVIQSSSWFSIIMYAIFIGFLLYSMRSMRNGGGLLGNFGQNNAKM